MNQVLKNDLDLVLPEVFKGGVPASEQETTINYSRDDNCAVVYTCDNTVLTKLKRLQKANPKAYVVTRIFRMGGEVTGVEVKFPKNFLTFRSVGKFVGEDE